LITGAALATPFSCFERLMNESPRLCRGMVTKGKRSNAVLLSEEDWNAINETLYLVSIPGMRESIMEGMAAGVDECSKDLNW